MYMLILLILLTVATGASLAWLYNEQKKQAELQAAEVNTKLETIDSTMRKKLSLTTDYVAGVEKLVKDTDSSVKALDDRAMGMVQGAQIQAVSDIGAVSSDVSSGMAKLRKDLQASIDALRASTMKAIQEPKTDVRVKNTFTSLIDMGENDKTREVNAGKISYKKWSPDSLDVIGAGQKAGSRRVRVWDQLQTDDVISKNTYTNLIDIGGAKTREQNAGKISYQLMSDGLDVIGAGTKLGGRKVRIWDQLQTDSLCLGDTCMSQADLKRILSPTPAQQSAAKK
jgi:hypothetical protein